MKKIIDNGYVCECTSLVSHSLPVTDKEYRVFGREYNGMPPDTIKFLRSPTCSTLLGENEKIVFVTDNFHIIFKKKSI